MPSNLTDPAAPAGLPRSVRVRLLAATWLGNAAALASRLAGKGSGASIRGKVLTRLAPDAFAQLLQGRRVLAVSGTNGKTTTTHLLASAAAWERTPTGWSPTPTAPTSTTASRPL
jgi:hypothetical protein